MLYRHSSTYFGTKGLLVSQLSSLQGKIPHLYTEFETYMIPPRYDQDQFDMSKFYAYIQLTIIDKLCG